MQKLKLTGSLRNNKAGYNQLVSLFNQSQELWFEDIQLDCSGLNFIDANLFAVLGAFFTRASEQVNTCSIHKLKPTIQDVIQKNGFAAYYKLWESKPGYQLSFKKFKTKDSSALQNYIAEFLYYPKLPTLSSGLEKAMQKKLHELFQNAHDHGGCEEIFTCVQAFPKDHSLYFTVVDLGRTVQANVSKYLNKEVLADESLTWAFTRGNTTRSSNIPGGLGLKLIRDFLYRNQGELFMVSANGYLHLDPQGNESTSILDNSFPGTIVTLKFNLNDSGNYSLKSEVKPIQF